MNSSNSVTSRYTCHCGLPAILKTARTDGNRGRRFLGCQNFKGDNKCKFFLWIDHEADEASVGLKPKSVDSMKRLNDSEKEKQELYRHIGKLENKIEVRDEDYKKMKKKLRAEVTKRNIALLVAIVIFLYYKTMCSC